MVDVFIDHIEIDNRGKLTVVWNFEDIFKTICRFISDIEINILLKIGCYSNYKYKTPWIVYNINVKR